MESLDDALQMGGERASEGQMKAVGSVAEAKGAGRVCAKRRKSSRERGAKMGGRGELKGHDMGASMRRKGCRLVRAEEEYGRRSSVCVCVLNAAMGGGTGRRK